MWKTFTLQGFVFTGEKQRRGLCVRVQTIFRCVVQRQLRLGGEVAMPTGAISSFTILPRGRYTTPRQDQLAKTAVQAASTAAGTSAYSKKNSAHTRR